MTFCKNCQEPTLRRTARTWRERLLGHSAAYYCTSCGMRQTLLKVKHCWKCGTDLDRRKRETTADYLAAGAGLWPYSCRRCGARRYRWGQRSGH